MQCTSLSSQDGLIVLTAWRAVPRRREQLVAPVRVLQPGTRCRQPHPSAVRCASDCSCAHCASCVSPTHMLLAGACPGSGCNPAPVPDITLSIHERTLQPVKVNFTTLKLASLPPEVATMEVTACS